MPAKTKAAIHKKGTITLAQIIKNTRQSKNYRRTGAVTLFIGTVRGETQDRKVTKLELEAFEEQANTTLHNIRDDLRKRSGITDVQIHHLIGTFKPGEDLVYVLVAGTHRGAVFPTLQEAVERYKREVPIFKKEHTINKRGEREARWVTEHERRRR